MGLKVTLEVDAKRHLTGTVSGVVCGLHRRQHSKRAGIADVGSWYGEVRAVDDVSECRFKAHMDTFTEAEYLGHASRDGDGPGSFQGTNRSIAGLTKRSIASKGIDVEVVRSTAVRRGG